MSNKIQNLLRESSTTASSSNGRPDLLGLTRATHDLIFTDLVAVQPSSQPEATLYGVKYLNRENELSFMSAADFTGAIGSRDEIKEFDSKTTYKKDDLFKHESVVYKVLKDDPFNGLTGDDLAILKAGILGDGIRYMSDAADVTYFETENPDISEGSVVLDRWSIPTKTRKIKTSLTVEFAQDLRSSLFESGAVIDDMLATMLAEDVNKEIIQKLVTVSSRYKVKGIADNGILDLTGEDKAPEQARSLYRYVCELDAVIQKNTTYGASYVLASSRCAAILAASGWLEYNPEVPLAEGVLKNGLPVYSDPWSIVDYIIVGTKQNLGDLEHIGSLFYAPYVELDGAGAYKLVIDPKSLQPKLALMARYGVSVNPYTVSKAKTPDGKTLPVVKGDDWDNLVGKSKMSYILGVKLPELIEEDYIVA